MIRAKHNKLIYLFFKIYTKILLRKYFHKINLIGNFVDNKLPVILICNHISWWDGFWIMYLNMNLLHREFYFMMLEDQLVKYKYFKYVGAFSVKRKSRSVFETLKYTTELLKNSKNMVLIFPQGKIQSMHKEEFHFEKGIEYILKETIGKVQILFVANFVDYFSEKKPIVNIYLKEFEVGDSQMKEIENGYNEFYRSCIKNQILLEH